MAPDQPLVTAVTRGVQRADTVADLRERVCEAIVDAGHDFACFHGTDGSFVTASGAAVEPPDREDVVPTFRSASADDTSVVGGQNNTDGDGSGSTATPGDDPSIPGAGPVASSGEPVVTCISRDDAYTVTVPVVDDEHYGTLAFDVSDRVDDERERDRLAAVGAVIGQAISRLDATRERDRFRETLADERRQFEELHSVAASMVGCEDADSIYRLAIDAAENILEFDICGIDVVEDGYLVPKATSTGLASEDSQRLPADSGIAGETYQANDTVVVDDVSTHADAEPANPEYASVLSVPIDGVGVFQAGSTERAAFSSGDAELVELLMAHVSETLQRVRSDEALRESEEKYRTLVEQSHDAVAIYQDGALEFVNQRATVLFDRERGTLLDADARELFHPEDRAKLERITAELTAETGRQQTFEARIRRPDGDVRFCECNATSIRYDGDVAVLASVRDITERKERERDLERQNDRLEEFASVVSHDLRSPINVARGSVDLARENDDLSHLDRAVDALDRMEALVEDILRLARQGRLVDEIEPVALDEVARDAWCSIDAPNATLDVETDASVDADRTRLRELFENLFRNSVEHGSTGSDSGESDDTAVAVTVSPCEGGFAVLDDGPGIPADSCEEVFEQGFSATEDGTGFGLAIVESIADAHGWDVEAVPSAAGARFEITGCCRN